MAGGPCPNPTGQCSLNISAKCTGNTSSLWYGKAGSKYCKSCYDKKPKEVAAGKRQRVDAELFCASPTPTVALSHGSDAWISEIYAVRSHRYRSPAPAPALGPFTAPSMPPARTVLTASPSCWMPLCAQRVRPHDTF